MTGTLYRPPRAWIVSISFRIRHYMALYRSRGFYYRGSKRGRYFYAPLTMRGSPLPIPLLRVRVSPSGRGTWRRMSTTPQLEYYLRCVNGLGVRAGRSADLFFLRTHTEPRPSLRSRQRGAFRRQGQEIKPTPNAAASMRPVCRETFRENLDDVSAPATAGRTRPSLAPKAAAPEST